MDVAVPAVLTCVLQQCIILLPVICKLDRVAIHHDAALCSLSLGDFEARWLPLFGRVTILTFIELFTAILVVRLQLTNTE